MSGRGAKVNRLLDAFRQSQVMFTATQLGIFEICARESGGVTAAHVANEICAAEAPTHGVARLLDACVSLELLDKSGGGSEARYKNNEESEMCLRDVDGSLRGYVLHSANVVWPLWGQLPRAVQEGNHTWEATFGKPPQGVFEHLYSDDSQRLQFMKAMHSHGSVASPAVVKAFDLAPYSHLLDLGGATGHLAIEALRAYPHLTATVADLPHVIMSVEKLLGENKEAAEFLNQGRLRLEVVDFTDDAQWTTSAWEQTEPCVDIVAMGRILHDWDDEMAASILSRCSNILPRDSHAGILLAEQILNDDHIGPLRTNLQDLNMLVQTNGKERSLPEFTVLLSEAGFSNIEGKRTGQPLDVILGTRAK